MKHKLIAAGLITALLCMIVGNSAACTTVVIDYHLTISATPGGQVTKPGEGRFTYCQEQGKLVSLVAIPYPGYRFVRWTGDVRTVADVDAAVTTITVNHDYSITANFAKPYSLTISSTEGGSVTTPGEGTFVYSEGDKVKLVASPDPGYQFVKWTGDVGTMANVNAASTTITMIGDYRVTANFINQYDLAISSTDGGSVTTPGEGTFAFDGGTVVNLLAEADTSYRFANWTGDVRTIANVNASGTTITMNDDYSITANFVAVYDLTISSTDGGSVATPGEGIFAFDRGTVVNLSAKADTGYRFLYWSGDADTITDIGAAVTSITMDGDYSIRANFVKVCSCG